MLESIRNAITRLQKDRLGRNLGVPNIGNAITPLKMGRLERLLAGLVQATPLLQNRFLGRYCYCRYC